MKRASLLASRKRITDRIVHVHLPTFRMAAAGTSIALALALGLYTLRPAPASDHQDSPLTVSRPGIDITDVYVYPSPRDTNSVVLAMDVSPFIPTGMGTTRQFDPGAMYQFHIGTGDDFTTDLAIQFKASGTGTGQQIAMYGPAKPISDGVQSRFGTATGSVAYGKTTTLPNGIKFFAGPREDPFYFDLVQFLKIVPDRDFHNQPNPVAPSAICFRKEGASDTLAGFNVLQLAVEVPRTLLADRTGKVGRINVWTTTSLPIDDATAQSTSASALLAGVASRFNTLVGTPSADTATYVQIERLGRPAVKEATENFADHDKTNRSLITEDTVLAQSILTFEKKAAHRSDAVANAALHVLIPDAIEADLSAPGPARYLAVETNGKSGLPIAIIRAVPAPLIYGIKRSLGDPYRHFGGRDLRSPVIDLSLGALFGSLIPKLGLAPEDHQETPCLTSDFTTPAAKHIQTDFPYTGAPR